MATTVEPGPAGLRAFRARWRRVDPRHQRDPAEGPVRPRAHHHHRPGRAAPGAGRLRLHGAPLADWSPPSSPPPWSARSRPSSTSSTPIRRTPTSPRSPASPASAWASTSPCCRPSRCRRPRPSRSSRRSTACSARRSASKIGKPFWIDTVGRSSLIEIRIQLDHNVLRVFAPRSPGLCLQLADLHLVDGGDLGGAARHRHHLPAQPDPPDPAG